MFYINTLHITALVVVIYIFTISPLDLLLTGNTAVILKSWPSLVAADILPPCEDTIPLATERPMP